MARSKQCPPLSRQSPNLENYRGRSGKVFGFIIGEPTNDLHPSTKSNETGLGLTTDWTVLLSGIPQISVSIYYVRSHKRPFIKSFAKRLSGRKCVSGPHFGLTEQPN